MYDGTMQELSARRASSADQTTTSFYKYSNPSDCTEPRRCIRKRSALEAESWYVYPQCFLPD